MNDPKMIFVASHKHKHLKCLIRQRDPLRIQLYVPLFRGMQFKLELMSVL
jgi:hypothetical protein